jgi:hypothetical protein
MKCYFLRTLKKNHIVVLILALSLTAWLIFPSEIAIAQTPPPEFADDKLAPNDLKPSDLGKNSRDDYAKQHPEEKDKPWIDKYYLQGEKDVMHDTANRAATAEKAAKYQRPTRGYKNDNGEPKKNKDQKQGPSQAGDPNNGIPPGGDEEIIGGGIYKKTIPKTDKEIVENVWRFAADLLWPKDAHSYPNDRVHWEDTWKFDEFVAGRLDIGKREEEMHFWCWENALFMASLLRELGYKVQYKNIIPSIAKNEWVTQTGAIDVWYDGKWHFYDPWENINTEDGYVNRQGRDTYHDYKMYKAIKPLTDAWYNWGASKGADKPSWDGWKFHTQNLGKDGAGLRNSGSSRMCIIDEYGRMTGWPGVDADSWNSSSPRVEEIPEAGYFNPTSLIAFETGPGNVTWTPLGEEILFWGFNNTNPSTLTYILEVINPLDAPTCYSIDLDINEVDRNITLTSPNTTILNGTLNALEATNITLTFHASAPRPTPPTPVQDLHVYVVNQAVHLTWSSVTDADYYTVYRMNSMEVPQNTSGATLIGSHVTCASFEETRPPAGVYFYIATATSEGGESALDPEGGSVEALQIISGGGNIGGGIVVPVNRLGLLSPYIGLASTILVATVVAAICVKRVKRRKEKQ